MIFQKSLKLILTGAVAISLSGCLGSSNSSSPTAGGSTGGSTGGDTGGSTGGDTGGSTGGSTGGDTGGSTGGDTGGGTTGSTSTVAEFNTKATSYMFLVPTMGEISGKARYKGEVSVLTLANDADDKEALIGDLDLNVDFGTGVEKPVSGTAGNFKGKIDGVQTQVTGTLSTANSQAKDPNWVKSTSSAAGTITSVAASLRGTVSDPTEGMSGEAAMIVTGTLMEDGATKMMGGASTVIVPSGVGERINTSGALWADKQ